MPSDIYTLAVLRGGVPQSELSPAGAALTATALRHLAESCRRLPGRLSLAWQAETLLETLSKVQGIEDPLENKRRAARSPASLANRNQSHLLTPKEQEKENEH